MSLINAGQALQWSEDHSHSPAGQREGKKRASGWRVTVTLCGSRKGTGIQVVTIIITMLSASWLTTGRKRFKMSCTSLVLTSSKDLLISADTSCSKEVVNCGCLPFPRLFIYYFWLSVCSALKCLHMPVWVYEFYLCAGTLKGQKRKADPI